MTKGLKSFFIGMSILFLTSCNSPFVSGKTVTLPDDIKNISSAEYLGKDVYALDTYNKRLSHRYKLINDKGELITKETVRYMYPDASFDKEKSILIYTLKGEYKLINKNGDTISKGYDSALRLGKGIYMSVSNEKCGYFDENGKEIVKPTDMKSINISDPNFLPYKSENGKYGFIDSKGKTIVPFIFDNVGLSYEKEELVPVCKDNKWGFIDKKGSLIIPYKFESASGFENGKSCVGLKNKDGVIDKNANILIPYEFEFIMPIENGFYRVGVKNNKAIIDSTGMEYKEAIIDSKGKYIIKPQDTTNLVYLDDKNMVLLIDGNHRLTDKNRTILTNDKYNDIDYYDKDLFRVSRNEYTSKYIIEKYGFINRQGKVIIPPKCSNFIEFKDNTCIVNINNKYGVVDINGAYKIDLNYDEIRHISKNYFAVKLNNKWGITDINGKIVKSIEYDDIAPINSNIPCEYNIILKQNNKALFLKIKE
ncbi:WG repeat-containing protein [Clostridium brassicae]|uniref:WG repeat-containing protein n=1 Tax=Clostridium brassicae TaxID=2999072 RepID=A0ABT4D814_9CLOT|nr:WG repeat-containing protein [Clostridium brassicae]MCY6957184.1 WG repeat-containing protein [Clostridium brassicae]